MELSQAQEFVFYRTYSRWNDELLRRETWEETVNRYFSFFEEKFRK
jgi:ribonucleoside-triphosphate reductase (thioredoxin)